MKSAIILSVSLLILGCEKAGESSAVQEYMYSISHELYQSFYLPGFGPSAIPELLTYRKNHKIIQHYPSNPISSFRGDSITVAHIALWTIESIRTTWLKDEDDVFSRYPSLNPLLVDTTFVMGDSFAILDSVAVRYYTWWTNSVLSTNERFRINPLECTPFRWR